MFRGLLRSVWLIWGLALASLFGFGILGALRPPPSQLWGDEGTYLAMAASLAHDHDLLFQEADLGRATSSGSIATGALILQESDRGISYSKPALYPILAAPFYALVGPSGILVLNSLVLALALTSAWRFLRVGSTVHQCWWLVLTFLGTGVLLPYVGWKISEILQASLALGGLSLSLQQLRTSATTSPDEEHAVAESTWRPILGSLLLGFLVSMRLTNIVVAAIPVIAALAYKRYRRAGSSAALILVSLALSTGSGYLLTGVSNPYKATRASFNQQTGYPVGSDSARALARFETGRATSRLSLKPNTDLRSSAYSTLYFFIGRHTGILWYFPATFLLVFAVIRRPDRLGLILMAGSGILVVTYLLWLADNYFGGSTFIGNRYFLVPYATLLLAPLSLPSSRSLLLPWCIAAAVFASALASISTTRHLDNGSQSHTRAGLFRMLPYDSTARRIDGQQDRRWLEDSIRFVDPFVEVRPWGFVLDSRRPPAELLIATSSAGKTFRFLVRTDVGVILRISDRNNVSESSIQPAGSGINQIISFDTSRAWRYHPIALNPPEAPSVRVLHALRFKILSQSSQPSKVWMQYLGDSSRLDATDYSYKVLDFVVPTSANAASTSRVPIKLLNTGNFTWSNSPILPVKLGYKLLSPSLDVPLEGVRTNLFRTVRPGGSLESHLQVQWPSNPGSYRLVVDLVQENALWFEERVGRPLAEGLVEVQEGELAD